MITVLHNVLPFLIRSSYSNFAKSATTLSVIHSHVCYPVGSTEKKYRESMTECVSKENISKYKMEAIGNGHAESEMNSQTFVVT